MLSEEAMIVRLSISQWSARKYDTAISTEVVAHYSADPDAGRWNKLLLAKEAIRSITQASSAARAFHYENTLPWDDDGGRLLPSKNFLIYSKQMREFKSRFETAVREFIAGYEEYRREARVRLNGMFDPGDYPGQDEIVRKFSFSTDIEPVPKAEDFRVAIQSKEMTKLKQQLENRVAERVEEATRDLYLRLNTVVGKLAEKLGQKEAIFRDSLVENVAELVGLLPKLNVTGNARLEALRQETKRKLCGLEPETLRKDETVRSKAAEDAKAILEKMSSYVAS